MKWYSVDIQNLTDSEYSKWYALMSDAKKQRVEKFRFAEDKKRTDIMNAIVHECGIKSAGAGICFSIPVDYVVGLNKHILEN
jgi:hypothetical protein